MVDKCPHMEYNAPYTTAEVADVISTGPVWQLPVQERSICRRDSLLPGGGSLGPGRTCTELSSDARRSAAGTNRCVCPAPMRGVLLF